MDEKINDIPALLGSDPAFIDRVNIVRPILPEFFELEDDVRSILTSGMVTKGRLLKEFEEKVTESLKVRNSIGVSSCTTGLMLVYQALGLTGDVLVPSFTFMATVSSLIWCGLRPVFVDVEAGSTNVNPEVLRDAITPRTSAIVGVHNFGNPARIEEIVQIGYENNIKVIFDAAHGFGALYKGEPVGSQGDAQVFSMSPTKLLITGEGGIVTTNNDEIARKIQIGREYGNNGRYDSEFAGINARLGEFNACLGIKSLAMLEQAAHSRNVTAGIYRQELGEIPGLGFQEISPENRSSFKDFSITIDDQEFGLNRDQLEVVLNAENIDTRKYYDPPVHRQKAYQKYYNGESLSATEHLARTSLSLPMWTNMDPSIVKGICRSIKNAHHYSGEIRQKIANGE